MGDNKVVKETQMTVFDFGVADEFSCGKCAWMRTYGHCYPKEELKRQYFYLKGMGRRCSDYCTAFASLGSDRK